MQTIRLVNSYDEEQVRRGFATEAQVHAVEIEAVVSTRATMFPTNPDRRSIALRVTPTVAETTAQPRI